MFRIRMLLLTMLFALFGLFSCNSSKKLEATRLQNQANNESKQEKTVMKIGMPNPASVYCTALGYKYEIRTNKNGGQYGVCKFPDGTECNEWDFYRGIKGQKWSYCNLLGYAQKDNGYNGWISGAICIDKNTGKEIGTLKKLVVDRFTRGEPITELRRQEND